MKDTIWDQVVFASIVLTTQYAEEVITTLILFKVISRKILLRWNCVPLPLHAKAVHTATVS